MLNTKDVFLIVTKRRRRNLLYIVKRKTHNMKTPLTYQNLANLQGLKEIKEKLENFYPIIYQEKEVRVSRGQQ